MQDSPTTIPAFRLPASTGQTLELDSFLGKVPLVIFFLADIDGDDDRHLLRHYDRLLSEFGAETCQLLGVARATARAVRELSDDLGLAVPVLADAGGEMARDFDAVDETGAVRRITVMTDESGHVLRRLDPAPTEGQAAVVLHEVRAIGAGRS